MGSQPDYIRKKYGPLLAKTLKNALAQRIHREFPPLGRAAHPKALRRNDP
jgi:hypothetical protein